MCKEAIKQLAETTLLSINPTSYGRIRSKLNKQGFSEIAIFTEIAKHCVENDIKPKDMASETLSFIEGCALNLYHPKTSNDCHFLRGKFYQIRHGNLEKGEGKSPEQKDMFLCNACFEVKQGKQRSRNKNEKHTCSICKSKKNREYQEKKRRELAAQKTSTPVDEVKPVVLSTPDSGFKHQNASDQLSQALSALPESSNKNPMWEPESQSMPESPQQNSTEQQNQPELADEPIKPIEQTESTELSANNEEFSETPEMTAKNETKPIEKTHEFGDKVKITEVIADEASATISLQCPTEFLHLILAAIKNM